MRVDEILGRQPGLSNQVAYRGRAAQATKPSGHRQRGGRGAAVRAAPRGRGDHGRFPRRPVQRRSRRRVGLAREMLRDSVNERRDRVCRRGVVNSSLDTMMAVLETGQAPQNVNFAIKSDCVGSNHCGPPEAVR